MEDFPSICQHSDQREACANFNFWPTARLLPAQNLAEFVKNQPVSQNLRTEVKKKFKINRWEKENLRLFELKIYSIVSIYRFVLEFFQGFKGVEWGEGEGRSRDLPS